MCMCVDGYIHEMTVGFPLQNQGSGSKLQAFQTHPLWQTQLGVWETTGHHGRSHCRRRMSRAADRSYSAPGENKPQDSTCDHCTSGDCVDVQRYSTVVTVQWCVCGRTEV